MIGAPTLIYNQPRFDFSIRYPLAKPTDSVACLNWSLESQDSNLFVSSSWDSKIRIYNINHEDTYQPYIDSLACIDVEDPCLSVSFLDSNIDKLLVGSINNSIKIYDVNNGSWQEVGSHTDAIKDAYWIQEYGVIISLSYDKTFKIWDPRQQTVVKEFELKGKPYCSDMTHPYLVVGLSNEQIIITELKSLITTLNPDFISYHSHYLGNNEQLTGISINKNGEKLGVVSDCGRGNICSVSQGLTGSSFVLQNILSWKGHKLQNLDTNDRKQILCPVNSFGFHPSLKEIIFTGGNDGMLVFWDYEKKIKIKDYNFYGRSITKAKLNHRGSHLVYALGYDWSRGIQGAQSILPEIYIHELKPEDISKTQAIS